MKHSFDSESLTQEVDEVAVSSGEMKLDGFISLKGSHTKEGHLVL
jgi:hypothetical protein